MVSTAGQPFTIQALQAKWRGSTLKERSASQEHFIDLCRALGMPTPADEDKTGAFYTFEKGRTKTSGAEEADADQPLQPAAGLAQPRPLRPRSCRLDGLRLDRPRPGGGAGRRAPGAFAGAE